MFEDCKHDFLHLCAAEQEKGAAEMGELGFQGPKYPLPGEGESFRVEEDDVW